MTNWPAHAGARPLGEHEPAEGPARTGRSARSRSRSHRGSPTSTYPSSPSVTSPARGTRRPTSSASLTACCARWRASSSAWSRWPRAASSTSKRTPVAFARAIGGLKENASAMSMVAAGTAITKLIARIQYDNHADEILAAHRALMEADPDPSERPYAGRVRDVQKLDRRLAVLPTRPRSTFPPPPGRSRRSWTTSSRSRTATTSSRHPGRDRAAQFESIHPFTDGNGRIGGHSSARSCARRGVRRTRCCRSPAPSPPTRTHYFSLLTAYRHRRRVANRPQTSRSRVETAAREARGTARAFSPVRGCLAEQSSLRAGSAADRILPVLLSLPVFTVEQLVDELGDVPERSVYRGVQALEEAHVVEAVTERIRGRTYAAMDVLDEFEDLDTRIRERNHKAPCSVTSVTTRGARSRARRRPAPRRAPSARSPRALGTSRGGSRARPCPGRDSFV